MASRPPRSLGLFRHVLRRIGDKTIWGSASGPMHPHPAVVHRRWPQGETLPRGGGPETFDRADYFEINEARMSHLASLGLSLQGKRVLDVGCGVGHLAQFLVQTGCEVVCVDARKENIERLQSRYPDLEAHVANVESCELSRFGSFDVVFCYGLLYHLENPLIAFRNLASVCNDLLLLETMVCDNDRPVVIIEDESAAFSQSLGGLGSRPSPSYVVLALNRVGFGFVYAPRMPPTHQDFVFEWRNDLSSSRDGHPLRCIFAASWTELQSSRFVSLLVDA